MTASMTLILKIVAVVFGVLGGAFIGYIIAPWTTKNRKGQSSVTIACALVCGLAMLLVVTRTGGGGTGLGDGMGLGGDGLGVGSQGTGKDPSGKSTNGGETPIMIVKVHMLGGERVLDDRFYVLDKESARDWPALQNAIKGRKEVKEIEILIYEDSVDRNNPAVAQLEHWARKEGFTIKFTFVKSKAP